MIFIPSIILIIVFYFYQRKRERVDVVTYLFFVYLLMCVSSMLMYYSGLFPGVYKISLEAMTYLSFCFIIIFYGFYNYNDHGFSAIKINNHTVYKYVENTILVGGLGSLIFFFPFAMQNLSGDVRVNRMLNKDIIQVELSGYGIINSLFSLFSSLFILSLLFAFINYAAGPKHRRKAFLMLVSSFSFVFYILAYTGRDGVVFWLMSFIFIYLIMKDYLNKELQKNIKRLFLLIIPIVMVPFIIITIARFSSGVGLLWQIVSYMGQQIKNFNDVYLANASITYGRGAFPLFADWLSRLNLISGSNEAILEYKFFSNYAGVNTWVFKTYIGSFLNNFGKVGTVFILLLLTYFSRKIFKKTIQNQTFNLSSMIIYILLYQNVLWGVFYFRFSLNNIYLVAMLLIAIVLNYKNHKNPYSVVYLTKMYANQR